MFPFCDSRSCSPIGQNLSHHAHYMMLLSDWLNHQRGSLTSVYLAILFISHRRDFVVGFLCVQFCNNNIAMGPKDVAEVKKKRKLSMEIIQKYENGMRLTAIAREYDRNPSTMFFAIFYTKCFVQFTSVACFKLSV